MKHTPGPWHLQDYNGATVSIHSRPYTVNPENGDCYPNGQLVAKVWLQGSDFDDANANLIAAAPEMLEQLERCLANIETLNAFIADRCPDMISGPSDTEVMARKVIAKARGGAKWS